MEEEPFPFQPFLGMAAVRSPRKHTCSLLIEKDREWEKEPESITLARALQGMRLKMSCLRAQHCIHWTTSWALSTSWDYPSILVEAGEGMFCGFKGSSFSVPYSFSDNILLCLIFLDVRGSYEFIIVFPLSSQHQKIITETQIKSDLGHPSLVGKVILQMWISATSLFTSASLWRRVMGRERSVDWLPSALQLLRCISLQLLTAQPFDLLRKVTLETSTACIHSSVSQVCSRV